MYVPYCALLYHRSIFCLVFNVHSINLLYYYWWFLSAVFFFFFFISVLFFFLPSNCQPDFLSYCCSLGLLHVLPSIYYCITHLLCCIVYPITFLL